MDSDTKDEETNKMAQVIEDEAKRAGPYFLRPLLEKVPVSADGSDSGVEITCVELWEDNLYIGTSEGEILHYVLVPTDESDVTPGPTFILASRSQPPFAAAASGEVLDVGIQQILLLPKANKACILCNGTLTFYSLPELSPAFGATQVRNCNWVGGTDMNLDDSHAAEQSDLIMLLLKSRIRLIRVGQEPRPVKVRKIPLFPISSVENSSPGQVGGRIEPIRNSMDRSSLSRQTSPKRGLAENSHGRSTSLSALVAGLGRRDSGLRNSSPREQSPRPQSQDRIRESQILAPAERLAATSPHSREGSTHGADGVPPQTTSMGKPLPPPPPVVQDSSTSSPPDVLLQATSLKPHVLSPTPEEFLLTTGTTKADPGVGIFVNMEGDVCRGTIQFEKYPEDIIIDPQETDEVSNGSVGGGLSQTYVLAIMGDSETGIERKRIEIQSLDGSAEDLWGQKAWLQVPLGTPKSLSSQGAEERTVVGLRRVQGVYRTASEELSKKLQLVPLLLSSERERHESSEDPNLSRLTEEGEFARRFSMQHSRLVLWGVDQIWALVRNPLAMRLEAMLGLAVSVAAGGEVQINRKTITALLHTIRAQDPRTETEFLSFGYIRQKASLLLFTNLMEACSKGQAIPAEERQITMDGLLEGSLDPRVIMAMTPFLRQDIVKGQQGIWVHGGIRDHLESNSLLQGYAGVKEDGTDDHNGDILQLIRRYLSSWRRKKGFGSIADEEQVFSSVDAGLLHVLLMLDQQEGRGSLARGSVRAELYTMVDSGVDCWERAIALLERDRRLYLLSRLYHSRKQVANVLATWRRLLEGEGDDEEEFVDAEIEVRRYVGKIRDRGLVQEYGMWLARRNPALGIELFADERSRVRFEPTQVISLLKSGATDALRLYLEHLASGYVDELISYYLDRLLPVLATSADARSILDRSYESYRALRPPRPTYREFLSANAVDEEWWNSRLRLLELLGGSHGPGLEYDVSLALSRLEPYEKELVPEMIMLDGKQGRHASALRLLIHGLGDYDSAINYCVLGGSSLFYPTFGVPATEVMPSADEQTTLFGFLLSEFLRIQDAADRAEQTGALLERFGRWYDVSQVLRQIPDSWSLDMISGFLVHALRRLLAERNETTVAKALCGAENLQISAALIDRFEKLGPVVETDDGGD
ncbi:MAG: hypothetical protein M1826_001999 [Phylliscum demangeonii]|nr:MAG: hypothetical protein M1826_001999 [Phylliscum demangeonii]